MKTEIIEINNCKGNLEYRPTTIKELYEWAVANGLENNFMSDVEGNIISSFSYNPWQSVEEIKETYYDSEDEDVQHIINSEFSVSLG